MTARRRRRLFAGAAGAALFVFALSVCAELFVRWNADTALQFRLDERRLHCIDGETGFVLLCPSVSVRFKHPAGFAYRVTTDRRGERTAYAGTDAGPDPRATAVWIIGDSIAMGFGNDDREYLAHLLAAEHSHLFVRNLGVDSLGSCGIQHVFERALHAARTPPRYVFWIFNPSDFIDDPRDARRRARPLNAALFRIQHVLTRHLALPDALRLAFAGGATDVSYSPGGDAGAGPGSAFVLPADHPTLACARAIFHRARAFGGLDFYLVLYPDIDRATGRPRFADPLKAPIAELAADYAGGSVTVLDLDRLFARHASEPELYLPEDGHPGPGAQRLFVRGLAPLLRRP